MDGLTLDYVDKLGKKICGKMFLGCFSCDAQLNVKKKFTIIFNLSRHNQKGSHYVAISRNKNKIIYFDPFGHACTNTDIKNFIASNLFCNRQTICESSKKIQHYNSNFCGFYCLGFCLSQKFGIPFETFVNLFKTNSLENDNKIIEFIVKHSKNFY